MRRITAVGQGPARRAARRGPPARRARLRGPRHAGGPARARPDDRPQRTRARRLVPRRPARRQRRPDRARALLQPAQLAVAVERRRRQRRRRARGRRRDACPRSSSATAPTTSARRATPRRCSRRSRARTSPSSGSTGANHYYIGPDQRRAPRAIRHGVHGMADRAGPRARGGARRAVTPEELLDGLFAAITARDVDAVDDLYHADMRFWTNASGLTIDREGSLRVLRSFLRAGDERALRGARAPPLGRRRDAAPRAPRPRRRERARDRRVHRVRLRRADASAPSGSTSTVARWPRSVGEGERL